MTNTSAKFGYFVISWGSCIGIHNQLCPASGYIYQQLLLDEKKCLEPVSELTETVRTQWNDMMAVVTKIHSRVMN